MELQMLGFAKGWSDDAWPSTTTLLLDAQAYASNDSPAQNLGNYSCSPSEPAERFPELFPGVNHSEILSQTARIGVKHN